MKRLTSLAACSALLVLSGWNGGMASDQSTEALGRSIAVFGDPTPLYDLSCKDRIGPGLCETVERCEARVRTLRLLARAMDSGIPSLISNATRQATSEYGRNETDELCFNALANEAFPELFKAARNLASADQEEIADVLGVAEAFLEDSPGCPSNALEGPTIARYDMSELETQVTFPLAAIGNNNAENCLDGVVGYVSQRPQVTFHFRGAEGEAADFEVFYSQCDTLLVAAAANGRWVASDTNSDRPKVRLQGKDLDGSVGLWLGTNEANMKCNARLRVRAVQD